MMREAQSYNPALWSGLAFTTHARGEEKSDWADILQSLAWPDVWPD